MKHLTNWIEIPVTDMKRAVSFYGKILGIALHEMAIGDMTYALFPSENKFNCGALALGKYYKPSADGVTIYLDGGDDLNKILERVTPAGGMVITEKMFLSKEAGYIGMFIDTEGNKIGLQNL
jgi:predicted enzyme related to lactoylglutathione lyase